jgi:hypothetical protein
MVNQDPVALAELETALGLPDVDPTKTSRVVNALQRASLLTLGDKVGPTQTKLLRYKVDDPAAWGRFFVPAFTREEYLNNAVFHNREWGRLSRLAVRGKDLLDAVGDATLVLNPYTRLEYGLPPLGSRRFGPSRLQPA